MKSEPRYLHTVLKSLRPILYERAPAGYGQLKEENMLKAHCKRLAGRTHVLGNTIFVFDKDGYTKVPDRGRNREDYDILLTLNGVEKVSDAKPEEINKEPLEANESQSSEIQDKSQKFEEFSESSDSKEEDNKDERNYYYKKSKKNKGSKKD